MKTYLFTLIICLPLAMSAQNRMTSMSPRSGGNQPDGFHVYDLGQTGIDSTAMQMIVGGCVQISNFQWHGDESAFGVFVDSVDATGLENGLLITTGTALNAVGPDDMNDQSHSIYSNGHQDLELMLDENFQTHDANWIEFDFTPLADTIFATDFVFGSEEYPEYVNSAFNDVFGFFISGPGIEGPYTNGAENIAYVPGTTLPIAINNVNNGFNSSEPSAGPCLNCDYYVDNTGGPFVQYDAMTTAIALEYPVVAGETYHFTIAIADVGDYAFDSGVFLGSESFCGKTWFQKPEFIAHNTGNLSFDFANHSEKADTYYWDFGDGVTSFDKNPAHDFSTPGNYEVSLTCSNACFDTSMTILLDVGMITDIARPIEIEASVINMNNSTLKLTAAFNHSTEVNYQIIDILGRGNEVKSLGVTNNIGTDIDISYLKSGAYILNLATQNSRESIRFVKM
ncbi:MAG: PKD repeat protein [Granulosicoccus sp.]|jgi:PKD repeat protein